MDKNKEIDLFGPKKNKKIRRAPSHLPEKIETSPTPRRQIGQIVAGHKLTKLQLDVFSTFHTLHNGTKTCAIHGININTLTRWKKTEWWKELELDTIMLWHSQMQNKFMSHEKELFDAYLNVLEGDFPDKKGYAASVMKAMELYLKSSPLNIRATLVPRADVHIETKEEINLNITIDSEKVKGLSPEEITDWVRSGVLPAGMTEQDIEDIEYEEIEDEIDGNGSETEIISGSTERKSGSGENDNPASD